MDINERVWYMPYCTEEEIDRLLYPRNAKDYLLRQRADIIADNPRYCRVYTNKANYYKNWSLEKSFKDAHYRKVLCRMSPQDKSFCKRITYGDMFSDDVNGYAENNKKWGRIIYLNESLHFFMKFCNLALLNYDVEVPFYVRCNALRIAIRIMMKSETMDFFLDPRGKVPRCVLDGMHEPIVYELQYIAGHEFCHHLCNHFNDENTMVKTVLSLDNREYKKTVYNVSQQQELEADLASLNRPLYHNNEFSDVLRGALLWFISLDLGETAQEFVSPSSGLALKTHPSAIQRFDNIVNNIDFPKGFNTDLIESLIKNEKLLKEWLLDDLSVNYDNYEVYGSVYLDKPDSEWRGRELIDRVDY